MSFICDGLDQLGDLLGHRMVDHVPEQVAELIETVAGEARADRSHGRPTLAAA